MLYLDILETGCMLDESTETYGGSPSNKITATVFLKACEDILGYIPKFVDVSSDEYGTFYNCVEDVTFMLPVNITSEETAAYMALIHAVRPDTFEYIHIAQEEFPYRVTIVHLWWD